MPNFRLLCGVFHAFWLCWCAVLVLKSESAPMLGRYRVGIATRVAAYAGLISFNCFPSAIERKTTALPVLCCDTCNLLVFFALHTL
jgi:hypothetical protein